jgi:hypothetical protein
MNDQKETIPGGMYDEVCRDWKVEDQNKFILEISSNGDVIGWDDIILQLSETISDIEGILKDG